MTERSALIDAMIVARNKLKETYDMGDGKPVLYYPVRLVDQAKSYWGDAVRVVPILPLDADDK